MRFVFPLLTILVFASSAFSQEALEVEYAVKNRTFTSFIFCDSGESLVEKKSGKRIAIAKLVSKAKKLHRKKKSAKTKNSLKKQLALQSAADSACDSVPPSPDIPPSGTPSPTPTPTPDSGEGMYESNGDVTRSGKIVLGIPLELNANLFTGLTVWQNTCSGCHEERRRDSFDELRSTISQAPMFFTEGNLSDEDLAQIMAYFGRFQQF